MGSFGPGKVMGGAGGAGVTDFALGVLRFLVEAEAEGILLAAEDALEGTEWVDDRDTTTGV